MFICLIVTSLTFYTCQKNNIDQEINYPDALVGEWELQEVQAGMTPVINYEPGNGNRLEFKNKTYKKFSEGILTSSGNYTVVLDTSALEEIGLVLTPGEFENRIIFDRDTASSKIFLNISNDQLTLLSGYFPLDAGSKIVYIRK